jgi:hypothetical protein
VSHIIGFAGPKRAGKNTAGLLLDQYGWEKYEMSFLLRACVEKFLDFKMSDAWYEKTKDEEILQGRTYRDLYIGIGHVLRTEISDDILTQHMIQHFGRLDKIQNMYVPNVRLNTEAGKIVENSGFIIEIVKDGKEYDDSEETERRIDGRYIAATIENNGSISQLHDKIKTTLENFKVEL